MVLCLKVELVVIALPDSLKELVFWLMGSESWVDLLFCVEAVPARFNIVSYFICAITVVISVAIFNL